LQRLVNLRSCNTSRAVRCINGYFVTVSMLV
jgi:hypothetical protein